ncbi:MAG: DUF3300 domain-containing protein [Proteobacteria bacterium]|nr:DUF3300 domain-containing protein [Pseudomonadota bacterium]
MRIVCLRGCAALVSLALVAQPALAQPSSPPPGAASSGQAAAYSAEQLDALLAPIALYPDDLLAQVLMASTYPLQIVEASRWLAEGNNKSLSGDALAKALGPKPWDPSVKSIVPFPQVLEMMNQHLDWTQQLGYAAATQQNDVMGSIQRLRAQAQQAGTLKTTEQQVVRTTTPPASGGGAPQPVIVIEPANPQVVYVPVYNPTQVFGTWPYATPPVYLPPPPGYAIGSALVTGMAFAAGVAVVGSLWGWARPNWGWGYGGGWGGSINVNTNRYNNITVNNVSRGTINNGRWLAPPSAPGRLPGRPPSSGPVGAPRPGGGFPPNAVGRPSVSVPGGAVNRPNIGQRPGGGPGAATGGAGRPADRPPVGQRPGAPGDRPGIGNRPPAGQGPGAGNRPEFGQGAGAGGRPGGINRPDFGGAPGAGNRPNVGQPPSFNRPATRPAGGGAFAGMNDGARAGQFQARGAQSRNMAARPAGGGGGPRMGGGGGPRAGGGGRHR